MPLVRFISLINCGSLHVLTNLIDALDEPRLKEVYNLMAPGGEVLRASYMQNRLKALMEQQHMATANDRTALKAIIDHFGTDEGMNGNCYSFGASTINGHTIPTIYRAGVRQEYIRLLQSGHIRLAV